MLSICCIRYTKTTRLILCLGSPLVKLGKFPQGKALTFWLQHNKILLWYLHILAWLHKIQRRLLWKLNWLPISCPRYHRYDQHKNRQRKQSVFNLSKDYLPKKICRYDWILPLNLPLSHFTVFYKFSLYLFISGPPLAEICEEGKTHPLLLLKNQLKCYKISQVGTQVTEILTAGASRSTELGSFEELSRCRQVSNIHEGYRGSIFHKWTVWGGKLKQTLYYHVESSFTKNNYFLNVCAKEINVTVLIKRFMKPKLKHKSIDGYKWQCVNTLERRRQKPKSNDEGTLLHQRQKSGNPRPLWIYYSSRLLWMVATAPFTSSTINSW